MRSMIALLLLAKAVVAQPDPLLGSLTANLLGGQGGLVDGLLGGSGGGGLLEGLLGGDGLFGGLVSGLLGPLLGGGGGGLLGGVLGGAGGLLGGGVDGAVSQVGDLVTCVLSQLLGQVGGLLDQILGSVLGTLGLQGSSDGNPNPTTTTPLSFLEQLIVEIRQDRADETDVLKALRDGKIDGDDIQTIISKNVLSPLEAVKLLKVFATVTVEEFIESGAVNTEIVALLVTTRFFPRSTIDKLVSQGCISQEFADEVFARLDN